MKYSSLATRAGLAGASMVLAMGLAIGSAQAQDKFPSETIDVVTHAGAGGGTDATTRTMMIRGRRTLGTDMRVVSRRGGGGAVAMNYINEQPKDGYTIMTITPSHLMTIALGKAPITIDDMVGLARATEDTQFLFAKTGTFKDIKDALAQGKDRPLKIGGTHVAGIDQVAVTTFAKRAGVKLSYIPYEGGGDLVVGLIGGDIEIGVLNLSEASSQMDAGEVVPLVAMAKKRSPGAPDTPATGELGIDAYFATVRGFVAIKGVPEDRLKTLEDGIVKALNHSTFQGFLSSIGLGPDSVAGAEEWNKQIQSLYKDGEEALTELGFIKK